MVYLKETFPVISYKTVVAYPYCICSNITMKPKGIVALFHINQGCDTTFFLGGGVVIEIQLAQYICTGMWV